MTKTIPYVEPEAVPEGCVRVRWKGPGATTVYDFRGWRVRLKPGESLVVRQETWDNINDPALPVAPGRWELEE